MTVLQETNDKTKGRADEKPSLVQPNLRQKIVKQVIRCKLNKRRHLVLKEAIDPAYLDTLFPQLLQLFDPQPVVYNGGIAGVRNWKISCYLEVMEGGVPTADPHTELLQLFDPLLDTLNDLFYHWYVQQHPSTQPAATCRRLMTFVTRYTPAPGEQALLKHVDGAGKVDGSLVLALPMDDPFEGGGLTFWDKDEIHYDTRAGDVAFIDRAVWHQADPITSGTRWALVIFYKVE